MRERLLASLGAILLAGTAVAPGTAVAAPSQQARKDVLTVVIASMSPQIMTAKTKSLRMSVVVTNVGTQPLASVALSLRYGNALGSRGAVDQFARYQVDNTVAEADVSKTFALAPGAKRTIPLVWKSPSVATGALGILPLAANAYDTTTGVRLGGRNTFITSVPKDVKKSVKPTKVSYVWPVIDRPHRTTDSKPFIDDALTPSVTNGRLDGLVDALGTGRTGVTLAVDPSLISDVSRMATADYYYVKDGKTVRARKSKAAETWLSALRTSIKDKKTSYFLTPYGDVDTVALVRNRAASANGLLQTAYRDKRAATVTLAQPETYPMLAWPVNGVIDQATINRLVANNTARAGRLGSDVFLLNSSSWMSTVGTYTPKAAGFVQTGNNLNRKAIAVDETLQAVVSADTFRDGNALLAEQRFLAETAMITAERPDAPRTVVVAPERRWNPSPAFAKALLDLGGQAPWLKAVPLKDVAADPAPERQLQTYTEADGARELPKRHLDLVKQDDRRAADFAWLFEPKDESLRHAAMRAASTFWRGTGRRETDRRVFQSAVRREIGAEIDRLGIAVDEDNSAKSVTGSSGTLNMTLVNDLAAPVKVKLEIEAKDSTKLAVKDVDDDPGDNVLVLFETLEPGDKKTVPVSLEVRGVELQTSVFVRISNQGQPRKVVREQEIPVKTAGIKESGLFITIGALGLLVVGVGFRGMRARRRRTKEEAQHDGAAAG